MGARVHLLVRCMVVPLVIQQVSQLNLVILYPQNFMYHGLDEQNNVIFIDI